MGPKWIFVAGSLGILFFVLIFLGFVIGFDHTALVVSQKRLVPIYEVARDDQKIAITVDGVWGVELTPQLLSIFEEYGINITFFFGGYWLEKYPEVLKQISDAGHEIGNHSYTHPQSSRLSREDFRTELSKTQKLIEQTAGSQPLFFRPPFGDYNNQVIEVAREEGYQVIQWSIDSLDWKEPGTDFIVRRIMENVKPGSIILMHNNAPDTPEALRILLPELLKRGYEVVPLSELVFKENYRIESHSGRQVPLGGGE